MAEKSFAATPYSCHDKMLDLHIIMPRSVDNFIMASQSNPVEIKRLEDIHVPAYKDKLHFSG